MTDDRDLSVARALRDLPVPGHRDGFWADLESRLSAGGAAGTVGDVRSLPERPAADEGDADDGDAPIPLSAPEHRRRLRYDVRIVAAAAVVVVLLGAVVAVRTSERRPERLRSAAPPETTAPSTPGTTSTTAAGVDTAAAEDAVVRWLEAVGAGDIPTAAALTGPRSVAYANALTGGAGIEGFLVESGEGYGAWADSPDRRTTAIALDQPGEEIVVVVVSGTWTGEGGTGPRTDAIPAVRDAGGAWLVEPWAIEPTTGGRIEVIAPGPGEEAGFGAIRPDAELQAAAPAGPAGTFHFSLDDGPATAVPAVPATGGRGLRGEFDPPGDLTPGTHRFLIAYVAGNTVSAVFGTTTVEP